MQKPVNKPIIAVDIDDVLANLAEEIVVYSNKNWGTSLTIDDYNEHWGEMWKVDDAETKRRSNELHDAGLATWLTHKPEARPVLSKLSDSYTLMLVTSRRKVITRETTEWIDKYFRNIFQGIHFTGIFDSDEHADYQVQLTKADILKNIGAEYLIDDQPKHCFAAAEVGISALLFGNYPWNRSIKLVKNMVKVRDWQEVLRYFEHETS